MLLAGEICAGLRADDAKMPTGVCRAFFFGRGRAKLNRRGKKGGTGAFQLWVSPTDHRCRHALTTSVVFFARRANKSPISLGPPCRTAKHVASLPPHHSVPTTPTPIFCDKMSAVLRRCAINRLKGAVARALRAQVRWAGHSLDARSKVGPGETQGAWSSNARPVRRRLSTTRAEMPDRRRVSRACARERLVQPRG